LAPGWRPFIGFVEFFGFIVFVGLIEFIEFVGFIEFVEIIEFVAPEVQVNGSLIEWSNEFNPDEDSKGFHWAGRTGMGDSS